MRRNYYCLIAGMPEIAFDQKKLSIKPEGLKEYFKETLQVSDYKIVEHFYYEYDNCNILEFLFKKEDRVFNEFAIITREELEEIIKDPSEVEISYIKFFLEEYNNSEKKDDQLFWERRLTQLYYEYLSNINNKFAKDWFAFDFMLRNVMTAIISRKYDLDTDKQMIADNELIQSVAKSNAKDFGLAVDWPLISKVLTIYDNNNLLEREERIDMLKWNWINDETTFEYFSLEAVIAILLKLRIIERWSKADPEKGKALFVSLLEDIKKSGIIE